MSREPLSRGQAVSRVFREEFGREPLLVRSPGRINLIGEHTDYNEGFVLPAAIEQAIFVALAPREDQRCRLIATDFDERHEGRLDGAMQPNGSWPDYINGVAAEFLKAGLRLKGFDCVVGGDVPTGAGMSSSAAMECAAAFGLNELFGLGLDRLALIKLAQRAENEFVGVRCGIMDQFASVLGRAGHVIRLDCRSLQYEYVPFKLDGLRVVLFDTGVKHSLAGSEYNTRRAQCETGARLAGVRSLRDATLEGLRERVRPKDELVFRRCAYVVEENLRLQAACRDLAAGDLAAFGRKMFETHEGLRREFEVSCPELDFLVEQVKSDAAVLGARMMGGGFGGCTVNLIREDAVAAVAERLAGAYQKRFSTPMKTYETRITDGTAVVSCPTYA
ncbi:MAG: galactokinase [Elusimicrobia bacterium]|nr:galactokinase [Elusimicrobiota bacterium]